MKFLWLLISVPLVLAACSDSAEDIAADDEQAIEDVTPVAELYNDALNALQERNWKQAKQGFEEVERQHPTSQWAKRAQIMNAYAAYENQDYEEAVAILQRFVRLYPGDERIAYASYLIALSYYEQISDVGRDQAMTDQALQALNELILRYPESEYAKDARLKRDLTIDHLAGKEMEIGRYYMTRNEYLAAIKRFYNVIEGYQGTTHTAEALHRLVESYLSLGIIPEAKKYAAVLGHNYPASEWYKDSYRLLGGGDGDSRMVQPRKAGDDGWFDSIF
jgi:outer membrane protein assembly factor BamD